MLNEDQSKFIVNVLSQLTISPAAQNASETVEMVQSILKALTPEETKDNG